METANLIGCSKIHNQIILTLEKVAVTDAEVLLTGPSGVGKELYACHLHNKSYRNEKAFVPVNCGALSSDLIENELFGHVGGAFTGARIKSNGLVSEAEGGTLFLDEVDSLSMACQIKLLRFLQDKQYRRLGENKLRKANIRIIAATNADLESAVSECTFRKDLFFRLRVVPVKIPALKERPEDTHKLVDFFISKSAEKYGLPCVPLNDEIRNTLDRYSWPGNVRELENCISYLTCLQLNRGVELDDLPLLEEKINPEPPTWQEITEPYSVEPGLKQAKQDLVTDFERQYLDRTLRMTNGNVAAAARLSGKNRRALFELLKKYEIDPNDYRVAPSQSP